MKTELPIKIVVVTTKNTEYITRFINKFTINDLSNIIVTENITPELCNRLLSELVIHRLLFTYSYEDSEVQLDYYDDEITEVLVTTNNGTSYVISSEGIIVDSPIASLSLTSTIIEHSKLVMDNVVNTHPRTKLF